MTVVLSHWIALVRLIQESKCAVRHMLGCILALVEWKLVLNTFNCGGLSFQARAAPFVTETHWYIWPEINPRLF